VLILFMDGRLAHTLSSFYGVDTVILHINLAGRFNLRRYRCQPVVAIGWKSKLEALGERERRGSKASTTN
jgi:hypothetical protein